jgi:hypothetical protein
MLRRGFWRYAKTYSPILAATSQTLRHPIGAREYSSVFVLGLAGIEPYDAGLEIELIPIPLQPERFLLTCSGFVGEESYRLLVLRGSFSYNFQN